MVRPVNALTDRRPGARGGSYGPVLRWPGAKWQIAPWIVSHLPAHRAYAEPYAGSAAVLMHKPPVEFEVINDVDGEVVNLFRVLRERPDELIGQVWATPFARAEFEISLADIGAPPPATVDVERARRFIVRCWGAYGSPFDRSTGWRRQLRGRGSIASAWAHLPDRIARVAARLQGVQVESRPALELIRDLAGSGALLYVDPPYLPALRAPDLYASEMGASDHVALLELLVSYDGPVVLSGYVDPLYDDALDGWSRVAQRAKTRRGTRIEALWLNAAAAARPTLWVLT